MDLLNVWHLSVCGSVDFSSKDTIIIMTYKFYPTSSNIAKRKREDEELEVHGEEEEMRNFIID